MDKRFYRQLELYYLSLCSQSSLSLEVLATADGFGKLPGFHWLELDSSAQVVQPRPKQKNERLKPNCCLRQSDRLSVTLVKVGVFFYPLDSSLVQSNVCVFAISFHNLCQIEF